MIKKQLAVLAACLPLLLGLAPLSSAANLPKDHRQVYETSFSGTDTPLTGGGLQQQYFEVMDYWDVEAVKIHLHFQVSQITEDSLSSVTLSLNGTPFQTFRPSAKNNGEQRITLAAPAALLREGSNTLSVQGYLRNTAAGHQGCEVDRTPDHWLQVFNTSSVEVSYTETALSGGIRDFAARFAGIDTVRTGGSLLAIPENSTGTELEAAVYALAGMAKSNTLSDRTLPLLPYRADTLKNKEAVVMVAMYDHLPGTLKPLVSTAEDLNTHAVIQLVNKENRPTLIVTSKDESLLIKAGRLIGNPALIEQTDSDVLTVEDRTDIAAPVDPVNTNVTLTETGDKLTGPYHQTQTYFVSLPSNRSIADAGKVSLDLRYAQNLDFDRSLVTVSINDTPIGSKRLAKELANGDTLNLPIPQNLDISGNFSVQVAFDLELPSAICSPNTDQMPWALIGKDSMLHLKTKDRNELLFNSYPYPFLRDGLFNHIAVVLPQEMDDYSYRSLSNIFNLLGKYAGGNTGDVHFYTDHASADHLKNNNIIAIGSYKDNKVIRDHNDKLYFQYNGKGTAFVSNEKMSIGEPYGSRIGTLQLIESPYEKGHGLLAVTGARSEGYYLASKLISTEQGKWAIFGDGVVADKDGNVSAFRFKTIAGSEKDSIVQKALERSDVLAFTGALLLVLLLVIVSLLLLLRKHLKKRGDQK